MGPLEITTGVLAIANGTFTLTANFWKLKNVGQDLKICLGLLLKMRREISRARLLRNRKFLWQTSRPPIPGSLLDRVNCAIDELVDATNEMSKCIEGVRPEKSLNTSISVAKRFKWVYNEKDSFFAHQWILTVAHNAVLHVMSSMDSLPDLREGVDLAPPPAYEATILRSPSQQRALKGKDTRIVAIECEQPEGKSSVIS
ncbi:MAG: hypothetical protein Q9195_009258 [Heterodermia aff. obscurata]